MPITSIMKSSWYLAANVKVCTLFSFSSRPNFPCLPSPHMNNLPDAGIKNYCFEI